MKTLFIWNGINRLNGENQDGSWKDILSKLKAEFNTGDDYSICGVPFPVLYEEILLRCKKIDDIKESEDKIKGWLKENLSKLKKHETHHRFLSQNFQNIITTNYDYSFFDGSVKGIDKNSFPDFD